MKTLLICSYLCASLALLASLLKIVHTFQENDIMSTSVLLASMSALVPILQLIYSYNTASLLLLKKFKQSNMIDDFEMNGLENDEEVVQINFWLKSIAFLVSLFWCLFTLSCLNKLGSIIQHLKDSNQTIFVRIIMMLLIVVTVLSIPTVIYNLRTHNISRIRKIRIDKNN
jgi:hypothetical protein